MTANAWTHLATEAMLQDGIRTACLRAGWHYYHTFNSRRSDAGFPDTIAIRDGVLLALEIKAQRGRVSPQQRAWINAFNGLGFSVRAAIVRPQPKDGEISYDDALAMIGGTA